MDDMILPKMLMEKLLPLLAAVERPRQACPRTTGDSASLILLTVAVSGLNYHFCGDKHFIF
jgi:hypothetical protein